MNTSDYINQDTSVPKDNPLFYNDTQHNFKPSDTVPAKKPVKLMIIISLVIISIVLLITSTIIQNTKKKPVSQDDKNQNLPTENKTIVPLTNNFPTQFVEKFKHIQDNINTHEDFLPPQIDLEIGL